MGLILSMFSEKLFGPQTARIAMLGLDAAGKTTVLYKLKLNETVTTIPTIGFNVEEVTFHNLTMTVWDIGGQKAVRYFLKHFTQ
jgi:small GTP-binding protein